MPDIVVISGGTAGVGRAFARRYARGGAKVAVLGRGLDDLRQTAVDLVTRGASAALMIPCDVANAEQVARATARIEEELGPIDVWIDATADDDAGMSVRGRALRIGGVVAGLSILAIGMFGIAKLLRR
jgi:NAD(P)-dependent dehydrogenase (short-subunit alcohol dehydrogenase family)